MTLGHAAKGEVLKLFALAPVCPVCRGERKGEGSARPCGVAPLHLLTYRQLSRWDMWWVWGPLTLALSPADRGEGTERLSQPNSLADVALGRAGQP